MMRNLGGAFRTAILATVITRREQYHSNVIGNAVRLSREAVRGRIDQMAGYFSAHGMVDPAAAQHQAVIAIGDIVRKQALIMGFSDTFAILGILVFAAAMIVMMTKGGKSSGAAAH